MRNIHVTIPYVNVNCFNNYPISLYVVRTGFTSSMVIMFQIFLNFKLLEYSTFNEAHFRDYHRN